MYALFGLLFSSHKLSSWSGAKETPSGCNEAQDSAYKCDSDVEDDEVSEPTNENKTVQAKRSAYCQ